MTSLHIELRPAGISIQAPGIKNKKEEAKALLRQALEALEGEGEEFLNEIFTTNTEQKQC
jgi:hypothetical protein